MNTIVYQSSEFEQPTDGDQAYQDLLAEIAELDAMLEDDQCK